MSRSTNAVSIVSLSEKWPNEEDDARTLRKIDILEDKRQTKPIEYAQRKDFLQRVVSSLGRKEREILLLYYFEDLTMREIGLTLDLSESRVCQLHGQALVRLKARLVDWRDRIENRI